MTGILTITADRYHADPAETPSLSSTIARVLVNQSPLHAYMQHPRLNKLWKPDHDTKYDVGTVAHALLLQGENVMEVLAYPDWRTKDAKEERDAVRKLGRVPVLTHQEDEIRYMVDRVRDQLPDFHATPGLLVDGSPEQTLVWEDGGVLCRARLDWLHASHLAIDDLKTTTRSANPEGWSRTLFGPGYDIQAAFYRRGVFALTGELPDFRFIVAETQPPHAVSVLGLMPGVLELANEKIDHAIRTWARCLETDVWPAYPLDVCYVDLPPWETTRWYERTDIDAVMPL